MTDDGAALTDEVEAPGYALYSLSQIKWTAVFGGPLVATFMIRDNFRKLGLPKQAHWASFIGAGVVGGLIASSILMEQRLGRAGTFSLGVPLALVAAEIAKRTQGRALEDHSQRGGRTQPQWKALLLLLASFAVLMIGTVQLMSMLSPTATLEGGHEVTLEGYATKDDAVRTGAALTDARFLTADRPIQFSLGHSKRGWTLDFNLADPGPPIEEMAAGFEEVAKLLRRQVFSGAAVEVRLRNKYGFLERKILVDGSGEVVRR